MCYAVPHSIFFYSHCCVELSLRNSIRVCIFIYANIYRSNAKLKCLHYCKSIVIALVELLDSFKHTGHIMAPHPTQVLLNLLQPQCLHSSMMNNIASGFTICSYIYWCSESYQKHASDQT